MQLGLPGVTNPAREVEQAKLIRQAVGPEMDLMCDINQRWRPEQAIDIGRRVEDAGVGLYWLEDVTTHDDYAGLARVTAALSTPVAGGEYLYGIVPFRHMVEARSVDIVMIDQVRSGGITPWLKIAGMAEAFNLPVVSHGVPEIHVHLVGAAPNGLTVEYMPRLFHLWEAVPEPVDGDAGDADRARARPQIRRERVPQVPRLSLAEHPAFRRHAHQHLADRLEMDRAALALLGPGVDVAHAPLERVRFENRRGAGGVIDGRHHVARLMDRPGRGEAQLGVVLGAEVAGALGLLPHLADHPAQIRARRAQLRLALRDLRLDHVVVAQRAFAPAGDLVARDLDERRRGAARDARATRAKTSSRKSCRW